MKRTLCLFLATVLAACAQTFPVKTNSSGVIVEPSNLQIPARGSTTQLQYNNAGAFGGTSGLTWNSGTGDLVDSQLFDGAAAFLEIYNTSVNAAGRTIVNVGNSAHTLQLTITSTTNSTSPLTNGPTGESAYLATNASVPLALGVNGSAAMVMDTSQGVTFPALNAVGVVTTTAAGKLATNTLTNGQLLIGSTGSAPVKATLTGTANQVGVATGAGSITLSTPQDIGTASTPQFGRIGIGSASPTNAAISSTAAVTASSSFAAALSLNGTLTAAANGDSLYGLQTGILGTAATGTFTNLTYYGAYIASPAKTGSGTIGTQYGLYVAAPTNGTSNHAIFSLGDILSSSPTAGVGYATGAGASVTQITSRSTAVTINTVSGSITLVSAAGSATWGSFVVNDSAVNGHDVVLCCVETGISDFYNVPPAQVGSGLFVIHFQDASGTTTEQPTINFVVIKSVNN